MQKRISRKRERFVPYGLALATLGLIGLVAADYFSDNKEAFKGAYEKPAAVVQGLRQYQGSSKLYTPKADETPWEVAARLDKNHRPVDQVMFDIRMLNDFGRNFTGWEKRDEIKVPVYGKR